MATRRALLSTAARLLQANLDHPYRTTVDGAAPGTLHVYGRGGEPCRVCRNRLVTERVGADARVGTWCPRCQPPG